MTAMVARALIIVGAVLVIAGLTWPWLARIGLGRLPGDIVIRRGDSIGDALSSTLLKI